jgi:hypothetical protein
MNVPSHHAACLRLDMQKQPVGDVLRSADDFGQSEKTGTVIARLFESTVSSESK